ncbi:Predicted arabinose efflux permease, MFS family [Amycolatopsis xylanica]|uniref:Predicted arabinose efflux permease, MFS family n=1 Tax=Amycolatopsis xylanica TaxID=589385 RepID=A0A1H2UUF4_9PSEU|nr:MFS transporter [Amycolatopsis xylanica]SDW59214.1 Predicted arabinose efflux permease, MFS family [Amycolatopsis xylanica]
MIPLSRNRDYNILWSSQLFSELATEITQVAFPLLIIAMAGSPLQLGLVSSVLMAAHMAAIVPAGVIADRWDRKKVMVVCQGIRAAVMTALTVAVLLDAASFQLVLVVAVLEGFLGSVFDPAEHAALPQVVPAEQLEQAVARNTARPFIATLVGPAAAGLLFTVHHVNPFAADAIMLGGSFVALCFLRLPHRPVPPAEDRSVGGDIAEGVRWVLGQRLIRTTLVWMIFVNLVFSALIIIILAVSGEEKVGPGEIGLTMACLGAGGLLGGIFADRLRSLLTAPVILIGFGWVATALIVAMAFVPPGILLGVLLGAAMFVVPVANTTVMTYQLVTTPDALRGRLSSIAGFCSGGAGALGPLLGGFLASTGTTTGVLVCAGALGLVAAGTTVSPVFRRFPEAALA